ncbi:MAG TPA: hypothetical protein EYN58_07155 [Candidatus Poseidoniales archaeon]|nr:MAG: hypothetical protein CXX81_26390 [Euryarchaeota archaeon]HHZ74932.1 hypothetical protein [Candidatus Poseidoniales archaeon]PXY74600.1 MAG: hypothetical protein CXX81_20950 [Euryarchaeota archaeon]PXY77597.1 MAG: hypothetical protein CXX81_12060 [Euryarchaeota archaeon]PXY79655.1 MAG: hypothetical protein CXX81_00670 [Euryarchaeota archaeon]
MKTDSVGREINSVAVGDYKSTNLDNIVEWGDVRLQRMLPPLTMGAIHLLLQDRRESKHILPRIAAAELASGLNVHWVDGAGRIDPGNLVPLLHWRGCRPKDGLRRLQISRAHTAHQLEAQIERLVAEGEGLSNLSRLFIIDDLAAMFNDPQVGRSQGRAMLNRALLNLRKLASRGACVVISSGRAGHAPLPKEHHIQLRNNCDVMVHLQSLQGRRSSGLSLTCVGQKVRHIWQPLPRNQASLSDFWQNDSSVNG